MEDWPETIYFDINIEDEPKMINTYTRGEEPELDPYRHRFTPVMSDNPIKERLTHGDLKHLKYTKKHHIINKIKSGM